LASTLAISVALLTLGGLFAEGGALQAIASLLVQIVVVSGALALLLGILNLLSVHLGRVERLERGWPYSLVVIVTALVVIVLHAADVRTNDSAAYRFSDRIFEQTLVALASALAALICFFLVYSAYRLLREGVSFNGCLFTLALVLALLGAVPLAELEPLANLRAWLLEVPATAGSRGLLIGIALGTITVGLRVLLGQERAYREE
jgi:hypothetical protein